MRYKLLSKIRGSISTCIHQIDIDKFKRFLLVGLSNTLISFVSYIAAVSILPKSVGMASVAQLFSYATGIVWSYLWNRLWVFGSSAHVVKESGRFVIVQVSLMVISAASIGYAVDSLRVHQVLAWVIVMGVITIVNYFLLRFWAFKN
jgi:putative flippase GtrA